MGVDDTNTREANACTIRDRDFITYNMHRARHMKRCRWWQLVRGDSMQLPGNWSLHSGRYWSAMVMSETKQPVLKTSAIGRLSSNKLDESKYITWLSMPSLPSVVDRPDLYAHGPISSP